MSRHGQNRYSGRATGVTPVLEHGQDGHGTSAVPRAGCGSGFALSTPLPEAQTLIADSVYRDHFHQHRWNYNEHPFRLALNNNRSAD